MYRCLKQKPEITIFVTPLPLIRPLGTPPQNLHSGIPVDRPSPAPLGTSDQTGKTTFSGPSSTPPRPVTVDQTGKGYIFGTPLNPPSPAPLGPPIKLETPVDPPSTPSHLGTPDPTGTKRSHSHTGPLIQPEQYTCSGPSHPPPPWDP